MSVDQVWTTLGFKTKSALEQHVRKIVDNYANWEPLGAEPRDFMMRLFANHNEWAAKCGTGVASIAVAPPPQYPRQRCFWLIRTDGSKVDISWRHALLGPDAQTARSMGRDGYDVRSAARLAIEPQVQAARVAQRNGTCWVCGVPFAKVGPTPRTDIDHHGYGFDQLLREWLWLVGGAENVPLHDEGSHAGMADAAQMRDWAAWHHMWADLRLVHSACHKKLTARRLGDGGAA